MSIPLYVPAASATLGILPGNAIVGGQTLNSGGVWTGQREAPPNGAHGV